MPFHPGFAACTSRAEECSGGRVGGVGGVQEGVGYDVLPCQSSISLISERSLCAPASMVDAPDHLSSGRSGVLTLPLGPPTVCVHRHRHPPPLLLHVHLRLDVRGGPAHLPHAD